METRERKGLSTESLWRVEILVPADPRAHVHIPGNRGRVTEFRSLRRGVVLDDPTCCVGGKHRGQADGGGAVGPRRQGRECQRPPELHGKARADSSRASGGTVTANTFIRISSV